jgi:uncharacterized protein YjbJ (UPF0337 family)
MNKLQIKGDCNIVKGKLKQKLAKLANHPLQFVEGKTEELQGQVQKHAGDISEAVKKSGVGRNWK